MAKSLGQRIGEMADAAATSGPAAALRIAVYGKDVRREGGQDIDPYTNKPIPSHRSFSGDVRLPAPTPPAVSKRPAASKPLATPPRLSKGRR